MTNIFRTDLNRILCHRCYPSIPSCYVHDGKIDKIMRDIFIAERTIASISLRQTFASKNRSRPPAFAIGSHSAGGRGIRRAYFSHREAKATCARLLLYFLRGSVKYPTPNARSRIQVRRSTYVRLGFRRSESPPAFPASLSRSHVISPFSAVELPLLLHKPDPEEARRTS